MVNIKETKVIRVRIEDWRKAKHIAVDLDKELQDVMSEAVQCLIEKMENIKK